MSTSHQLKKDSLGVLSIVFFVIAAASPITGVVGAMPIAFLAGNGPGVPGVYLLAGVLLWVFTFGFVAMSRHVVNAGAFYSYISVGLGRKLGLAGLNVALLAYTAIQLSVVAMFGFITEMFMVEHFAVNLPWWNYSAVMLLVVLFLGVQHVELGGKVLGGLMLAEVAIVLATDVSVLASRPARSLEFSSFTPALAFDGTVGIAMIFAISSFMGFEATAIYSEECRNPVKTIPRATFVAVCLITLFFSFTSWAFVQYHGTAIGQVAEQDPGRFVFDIAASNLGPRAVTIMSLLLITSLFAATQAFHNTMSRYIFAIARDGFLHKSFAKTHPVRGTPYVASLVQTIFMLILLAVVAILQQDPMQVVFAWGSAIATMAILLLQGGVSVAVVVFFYRNPSLQASLWSRLIAPALAAGGMFIALDKVIVNLDVLSGSSSTAIFTLPYVLLAAAAAGVVYSLYLAKFQPVRYEKLGRVFEHVG
jgi:amino acid transporter